MNRLLVVVVSALVVVVAGGLLLLRRPPPPAAVSPAEAQPAPTSMAADPGEVSRTAEALAQAIREQRATETISRLGQQQNSAALARALHERNDDPVMRQAAIDLAARSGDPAAVLWLATLANADGVDGPRAAATLGSVTSKAAVPALVGLLASDPSPQVRASAARALAASGAGQDEAGAALEQSLGSPQEEIRVRQQAALALGQVGGPAAAAALAGAWERSRADRTATGEELRLAIIQGLQGLQSLQAQPGEQAGGGTAARAALAKIAAAPELTDTERAFLARGGQQTPAQAAGTSAPPP